MGWKQEYQNRIVAKFYFGFVVVTKLLTVPLKDGNVLNVEEQIRGSWKTALIAVKKDRVK